ncbi:hypothetical protein GCM10009678_77440 [Actinomadura kijaniata]|uniref:Repetin n=1 Tax=Actinomadura namibiensis TaxID=182080 RepID=A0A7W3LNR3_ACTNM|nr:hypothetical protein [Actinomadura namibiensis]MBA8951472.1 hypothetical protein [Actinomadura namibiensis]
MLMALAPALARDPGPAIPRAAHQGQDAPQIRQSVRGTAGYVSPPESGYPGDRIQFRFDARNVFKPDGVKSSGTFHVWHFTKDGRTGAEFTGRVTCLLASGDHATVTGRITRAVVGTVPKDPRVAFTVVGNGSANRIGYAGGQWGWSDVADCLGPVPFAPIGFGRFAVDPAGM